MTDNPRLGIQLYTVRDLTDDDSFRETLCELARLGFQGVEFAWKYGGMQPDALAAFLRDTGLACCGLHARLHELLDPAHPVYDYATACGSPYITTSQASRIDEWTAIIPEVDRAGAVARSRGLQLTYHNHAQEFARLDGAYALDMLRDGTNPANVQFELDLGWIQKGGPDAMLYWRSFSRDAPQIHLRDYSAARDEICDIGAGFIDVAAVVSQARELGTQWLIYEQDKYPQSPMQSAAVCIAEARRAGIVNDA